MVFDLVSIMEGICKKHLPAVTSVELRSIFIELERAKKTLQVGPSKCVCKKLRHILQANINVLDFRVSEIFNSNEFLCFLTSG